MIRPSTAWKLGLVGVLLLSACGTGDDEPDVRVAELEAELDQARQDADDLRDRNRDLETELAGLRDPGAGTDDGDDGTGSDGGGAPAPPDREPAPLWSAEGLSEQLRQLFDPPPGGPEEWEPGSTDWEPFELPGEVTGQTFDELGLVGTALLDALAGSSLGTDTWESTVRALLDDSDADQGYVAVLSWGFADDSVQGRDVRVTVTRTDDGWQAGGAEVRHHCLRGVTDDDLCV